jgi:hypothetical protein
MLTCCGIGFPESAGKYGCPNCLGDNSARVSRIVAGDSTAVSQCDVTNARAQTLRFPMQEISSKSIFARRHRGSHDAK